MQTHCEQDKMGNACGRRRLIAPIFKHYYRGQMIDLMHEIINGYDSEDGCNVESSRLSNLKKNMATVKGLSDSWGYMTSFCISEREPICTRVRKVLDAVSEFSDEIDVTEVMCMCTYITELCVLLISKNLKHSVGEVVETLADYILDQNMMACINFLRWLDNA